MNEKKIYLSVENWWEERKKSLYEDLTNAKDLTTDQEIVRLMQELLEKMTVNTADKEKER
jgi:hypothetical protein